jgi:hypothetical protein
MNVVEPFCRFLSLAGVHRSDLASACPIAEAARRPRPLLAVLGNHDYRLPGSPELEAIEVPRWIPEWHLSSEVAEVYELPGSVSVIALDSVRLRRRQDPGPIVDALKRARGDWRIVVAHHPFVANGQAWDERYVSRVREAIAQSDVSIHMLLAGHEHLLAAGITGLPEVPLQLVAGSGAHARPAKDELLGRTFELVEPGFIRVELIRGADGPALHAALIATASSPIERWVRPHVVACYSVDRDGRVHERESPMAR